MILSQIPHYRGPLRVRLGPLRVGLGPLRVGSEPLRVGSRPLRVGLGFVRAKFLKAELGSLRTNFGTVGRFVASEG